MGRAALLSLSSPAWRGGPGVARSGRAWAAAAIWLAWPAATSGQVGVEDPAARLSVLEVLGRCDAPGTDEIVVCGRRSQDRYRLSPLDRRESGVGAGNVRGYCWLPVTSP